MTTSPTALWWSHAARYRRFAERASQGLALDFSEDAARACYAYETHGEGEASGIFPSGALSTNGYRLGKQAQDIALQQWREAIEEGWMTKQELLDDPAYAEDQAWLAHQVCDIVAGSHRLTNFA